MINPARGHRDCCECGKTFHTENVTDLLSEHAGTEGRCACCEALRPEQREAEPDLKDYGKLPPPF